MNRSAALFPTTGTECYTDYQIRPEPKPDYIVTSIFAVPTLGPDNIAALPALCRQLLKTVSDNRLSSHKMALSQ